ncbi:MAG: hypothetical protein CME62_00540 [Halobacteriovoraceae bacterium]|nr:hypothetical protein [Halobacteriovoraceae bacterium]|tara:strand:+ start:1792 stop:2667 length:876 start_codon:yes stop_codon:yes gene_type:complete
MKNKHEIIFHKFPHCSMLKNEIIVSMDSEYVSFKSSENVESTLSFIENNPEAQIFFYFEESQDYEDMFAEIKKHLDQNGQMLNGVVISKELERDEAKKLKGLGIKKFFPLHSQSFDILGFIERTLRSKNLEHDEKIVIAADKEKKALEVKVNKNDEFHDDFRDQILETTEVKNLNLDSGQLNVNIQTENYPHIECKLEDFTQKIIELEMLDVYEPSKDENIEIKVVFEYNKCRVELMLEGKVLETEDSVKGKSLVLIQLDHDEVVSFQNFMALYQKRQKSIDEFMILAKGS